MEGKTINYPRENWVPGLKIAPEGLSWERGFFGKILKLLLLFIFSWINTLMKQKTCFQQKHGIRRNHHVYHHVLDNNACFLGGKHSFDLHRVEETWCKIADKLYVRQHGSGRFAGHLGCDSLHHLWFLQARCVANGWSCWRNHVQSSIIYRLFLDKYIYYLPDIHGGRQILCDRLSIQTPSLVSTTENSHTSCVDLINGFYVHRSSSGGLQVEKSVCFRVFYIRFRRQTQSLSWDFHLLFYHQLFIPGIYHFYLVHHNCSQVVVPWGTRRRRAKSPTAAND